MSKCSTNDIEKCISLAIKFEFMDEFIKGLITRANRNTKEVNVLLEYIEYLHSPERIIA